MCLDIESKPETALTIPNCPLYQFTRTPFGLPSAPQTLFSLMDKVILYRMNSHVMVYLYELLVMS